jgi:hypothetical protein
MNGKRISALIHAGLIGSALLLACASANAISISYTVDENGNYTTSPNGLITSAGLAGDTYLGSGKTVLQYDLSTVYPASSYVPVEGALYIYNDAAHTILSDVIVFLPNGPSHLYFMSLDNNGDKADVSSATVTAITSRLPSNANFWSVTEGANGVTIYTPTGPNGPTAQPGFMDNATATYTFESNEVPDGGTTVGLLGMGLVGLASLKKWLARA